MQREMKQYIEAGKLRKFKNLITAKTASPMAERGKRMHPSEWLFENDEKSVSLNAQLSLHEDDSSLECHRHPADVYVVWRFSFAFIPYRNPLSCR